MKGSKNIFIIIAFILMIVLFPRALPVVLMYLGLWSIFQAKKKTKYQNTYQSAPQAAATSSNLVLKCTECGAEIQITDEVCPNCNKPIDKDNIEVSVDDSPVVSMNQMYLNSEKKILRDLIIEEIKIQGEDPSKLISKDLNVKRNILFGVCGLVTLISVVLYFFNFPPYISLGVIGVNFIVFYFVFRYLNIVNRLVRQAIKSPDESISNIVEKAILDKSYTINSIYKLCLVLLVAVVVPVAVFFNPRVIYLKVDGEYSVFKYTKGITSSDEVIISETYKRLAVVSIEANAFENTSVKSVVLPEGLQIIKSEAFKNCTSLESIIIPETVIEIRASAFENCTSLSSVVLNEGLIEIRANAFRNCTSLVDITLPNSLEYLGAGVFAYNSSIKEITIPSKVIEINGETFIYCTSLERIIFHDDIISIHGETFIGCSKLDNVVLPTKITEIRGNTFEECTSLTSIIIPEGVTRIGGSAFRGCKNLSYVYLPMTIAEIGSSAFRQNYSLNNISIPYGAVVNERAFKDSPTQIEWIYE